MSQPEQHHVYYSTDGCNSVYQRYLEKSLAEKYKALDMHLEKTVNEANTEIENLQSQKHGNETPH